MAKITCVCQILSFIHYHLGNETPQSEIRESWSHGKDNLATLQNPRTSRKGRRAQVHVICSSRQMLILFYWTTLECNFFNIIFLKRDAWDFLFFVKLQGIPTVFLPTLCAIFCFCFYLPTNIHFLHYLPPWPLIACTTLPLAWKTCLVDIKWENHG